MKCIALRHVAFEDLGVFRPVLERSGFAIEYRQAGMAPLSLSEWLSADLVVVLGGPIGVYETDKYPWIAREIDGVAARLQRRLPTLGICLGAQLMAAALGARVYPGPAKEIGWSELALTDAGRRSSLVHLDAVPVLHWHGDTFDLPDGAERLASTALTPNQAFALDDFALATQFHAEVDATAIEAWLIGHACELGQTGVSVTALRERSAVVREAAAAAGTAAFIDWIGRLGIRAARAPLA